jgi:hypothetical protein
MDPVKLYMVIVGCRPRGRNTEQHDVLFTVGSSLQAIKHDIISFWPGVKGAVHIDSYREVTHIDGYSIRVAPGRSGQPGNGMRLFFINLGGYKPGDMEEYHYKMLIAAADKNTAIMQAKEHAFYKHTITGHIDDKFGLDVDDIHELKDILPAAVKNNYHLVIEPAETGTDDELHIGYISLHKL